MACACNPIRPLSTAWSGGKALWGAGFVVAEITEATPYNTYVIEGPPPGPIANPGRAAMEGGGLVRHERTSCSSSRTGRAGIPFSENYDQHRRAVGRWREIERDRRDADQIDRIDEADEVLEREGRAAA